MERRADDRRSAKVAEAIDGHEDRRIEPPIGRADDADGPGEVWTHGVRHAVESAVARHDVDGIAALRLDDRRDLPSATQRVARERQVVDGAEDESVARIEVRQPVFVGNVVAVLDGEAQRS